MLKSSPADSWFVQASFGTTLGPMTIDVLKEMARSQELLPSDLIRRENAAEWQLASNCPGLFSETLEADHSVPLFGSDGTFSFAETVAEPEPSTAVAVSLEPQNSVSSWVGDKLASVEPTAPHDSNSNLIVPQTSEERMVNQWKATRPPSVESMGLLSLAEEMERSEQEELFLPQQSATESAPTKVESSEPIAASPARIDRPSLLSQIEPLPQPKSIRLPLWNRSQSAIGTALLVVLLVAGWWVWPRSQKRIYERYVAIVKELRQSRDNFKDPAAFDQFTQAANQEVQRWVDWLTPRAIGADHEKQLLLFVGRDALLPMLKTPREKNSPTEKKLTVWMQALERMYSSTTIAATESGTSDPEAASTMNSQRSETNAKLTTTRSSVSSTPTSPREGSKFPGVPPSQATSNP